MARDATEAQRQLYENFSLFIRNFLARYPQPDADAIENLTMAVVVDQKRLGGGSHWTVGAITDIYTVLRLLYSRFGQPSVGYSSAFSFNDPQGMCPECNGLGKKLGVIADDFLDLGKSLNEGAVTVPVFAAWEVGSYATSGFFTQREIVRKLQAMSDVGVDYLTLGEPLCTLSGGEGQRIKLTGQRAPQRRQYLRAGRAPTTGLHMSDVTHLLAIMDRLVDGGNTVIVIEHNMDVIRNADWIIDLGPEGGNRGGRVVFAGTPMDLLSAKQSLTSKYLRPAAKTPSPSGRGRG